MAKKQGVEWFGADREQSNGGQTTTAVLANFNGVPAQVPKNVTLEDGTTEERLVWVQPKKNPRTRTTSKDALIAELTARYKMAREAFTFAPPDDKEVWERRRDIAYAEMQLARKEQQLANYLENPMRKNDQAPRPDQVRLYKDIISMWRGRVLELTGQGD